MRESLQLNQSGDRASTGRFAKSCFPNAWNTFRQCYLSVTTQSNKRSLLTLRNPSNVLSNISFFFLQIWVQDLQFTYREALFRAKIQFKSHLIYANDPKKSYLLNRLRTYTNGLSR